jgi:3-deoxy-D-manno-octulosonic acid (KDO) 8-phosphate synthase
MVNSAEKVRLAGNPNVMVCERGTMFGYSKFLDLVSTALCHIILNLFFFFCGNFEIIYLLKFVIWSL